MYLQIPTRLQLGKTGTYVLVNVYIAESFLIGSTVANLDGGDWGEMQRKSQPRYKLGGFFNEIWVVEEERGILDFFTTQPNYIDAFSCYNNQFLTYPLASIPSLGQMGG